MEFVYVVKRYELFDLAFPHGFTTAKTAGEVHNIERCIERIRKHGFFIERRKAEQDSGFKQVIPYCLVRHSGEMMLLKRTKSQGEKRLHNLHSVGVGGHINPVDKTEDVLDAGCERELSEEIAIDCSYTKRIVGTINDESNPVGSVHFGIVYAVEASTRKVGVRESVMMEGGFRPVKEISEMCRKDRDSFETWSQLIIDRVGEIG
jgi:predicted NUDIX family phosphoesterase